MGGFWPLAGLAVVACRWAMQAVYFGASGTTVFSPVALVEEAATPSQWA